MWNVFIFDLVTGKSIHANKDQPLSFEDAIELAGMLEDAESVFMLLPIG